MKFMLIFILAGTLKVATFDNVDKACEKLELAKPRAQLWKIETEGGCSNAIYFSNSGIVQPTSKIKLSKVDCRPKRQWETFDPSVMQSSGTIFFKGDGAVFSSTTINDLKFVP